MPWQIVKTKFEQILLTITFAKRLSGRPLSSVMTSGTAVWPSILRTYKTVHFNHRRIFGFNFFCLTITFVLFYMKMSLVRLYTQALTITQNQKKG